MATVNLYPNLPPNVVTIEEADRSADGIYTFGTGIIHVFPFEIESGGQLRVPINQISSGTGFVAFRQNLSIRVWISKSPNGAELFFRFHPGTGGLAHMFYDKDLNPPPTLEESPITQNQFSPIPAQARDIPVPLIPGTYYYNIQNMESSPANDLKNTPNSYRVGFYGPNPVCPPPYPEVI